MTKKLFVYTSLFLTIICLISLTTEIKANWAMPTTTPTGVPVDFDAILLKIINWILGFVASVATLVLIWGGVQYMTSVGDDSKAENGKKTITYGLIGLAVAGLAYTIVNVVVTVILV